MFKPMRCLIAGLVVLSPLLAGMTCGPTDPSPCELDRVGCEAPDETDFYLASCPPDVTDPLEVEIGSGEASFGAFAAGAGPFVHFGPQGGQHVFMAVRVKNARLDVSPKLKLEFYLGQGACAVDAVLPQTIPSCSVNLGSRKLVLGGTGYALHTNTEGAVEESGLVVFVEVPDVTLPGIVAVVAEDQCRRRGTAYQNWTTY